MKPKYQKPIPPNYLDLMRKLAGKEECYVDEISHDFWCGHWKGKQCNCKPDVEVTQVPDGKEH